MTTEYKRIKSQALLAWDDCVYGGDQTAVHAEQAAKDLAIFLTEALGALEESPSHFKDALQVLHEAGYERVVEILWQGLHTETPVNFNPSMLED